MSKRLWLPRNSMKLLATEPFYRSVCQARDGSPLFVVTASAVLAVLDMSDTKPAEAGHYEQSRGTEQLRHASNHYRTHQPPPFFRSALMFQRMTCLAVLAAGLLTFTSRSTLAEPEKKPEDLAKAKKA